MKDKCILFCRVSTSKQDWERQKEYCRVRCDGMYVFVDAVSMYVHVDSLNEACKYVARVKDNNMVAEEK